MTLSVLNNFASRFTDVPNGWTQRRMRAAVKAYQHEKNENPNPTVLSLTKTGLKVKTDLAFGKSTENYVGHQLVANRQFVFTPRDFDATPILCGVARDPGCISNLYLVFDVADEIHPEFLEYYFWGLKFGYEFFEKLSFGMRYSFNRTQFEQIPLLHPDLPTQKRIAAFLDRETARIDTLIAKKERLVTLLNERRIAARESLLWGDGPSSKLGHHISILPGYAFSSAQFSENTNDIKLLRGANVGVDDIRWDDTVFWPKDEVIGLERFQLKSGDLVMGMDRPWISNGIRVAQVNEADLPCLLLQRVCKISPRSTIDLRFLKAALESKRFLDYFEPLLTGVSVPHISSDQIANFRFPYLKMGEQANRMEQLEKATRSIRPIVDSTQSSITHLREYRAALITAAVTGQLDVDRFTRSGAASAKLDQIEEEMQG